jgi:hypothetical protein
MASAIHVARAEPQSTAGGEILAVRAIPYFEWVGVASGKLVVDGLACAGFGIAGAGVECNRDLKLLNLQLLPWRQMDVWRRGRSNK